MSRRDDRSRSLAYSSMPHAGDVLVGAELEDFGGLHSARRSRADVERRYGISVVEREPPLKFATQILCPSNAMPNGPRPDV
jgi:hypothetical protein